MENPIVIFTLDGIPITIQCTQDDLMKDICLRYTSKIRTNINLLLFLYGGNQINFELKFKDQANSIDKSNNEMKVLVYRYESEGLICPKCGEKIQLNTEKIDEIISSNNTIIDSLNGTKLIIESIIKNSTINHINIQLKNINIILNTIYEDIIKNNEKLKNLLKENLAISGTNNNKSNTMNDNINFISNIKETNINHENASITISSNTKNIINNNIINHTYRQSKNAIKAIININPGEINNNIVLFNSKKNDGINIYLNGHKISMIEEDNRWEINHNFENSGNYEFEIVFDDNIIDLNGFFEDCSKIISLDLSNLNSSNVNNMKNMFAGCINLEEIKGINQLITKKVTTMEGIFSKCIKIEYLNLSNFDTSEVTNMSFMFNECKKLKEIKGINNFITNKVTKMDAMFQECYELERLDLSNFDTSNVKDMCYMFNECYKLKEIKGINKFKTYNVTTMDSMFQLCKELENLDLSDFDTSNVIDMSNMFNECNKLKYLNLKNFTINCDTENMFTFQQKDKCKFVTNNKDLQDLYNSS